MVSDLCFNLFTLMLYFSSQSFTSEVGKGEGGGGESNLPSRRGWTRSYFSFNSGGCNFILRPTLLILEPLPPPTPLQIIIAQSLNKF